MCVAGRVVFVCVCGGGGGGGGVVVHLRLGGTWINCQRGKTTGGSESRSCHYSSFHLHVQFEFWLGCGQCAV